MNRLIILGLMIGFVAFVISSPHTDARLFKGGARETECKRQSGYGSGFETNASQLLFIHCMKDGRI